jgi:indole-3-glycerol phosphate synthase
VGFLTDLVEAIRADLAASPPDVEALERAVADEAPPRPFDAALRAAGGLAVIAEVKRASPSVGPIATDADLVARAQAYASGGAAAISVLTEPRHFRGSLDDLRAVRASVDLPLLRKDFIVADAQVLEARAAGADTVLLITSCLDDAELARLLERSRRLGMEPLVETHDEEDLRRALATDARVIGVNARNLESLEVDVDAALARVARLAGERLAVLESGVTSAAHAASAASAGASAILVGETLMRATDPAAAIRDLRAAGAPPRADRTDEEDHA